MAFLGFKPTMRFGLVFWLIQTGVLRTSADTISQIYGEEYLSSDRYFESGPFGGTQGGEWFTDFSQSLDGRTFRPTHWPDAINIRSGDRVDSIQMFYGPYHGGFHGGEGGTLQKFRLYDGNRIVRVTGRKGVGPGAGVDQLSFFTQDGQRFGPYGGIGGYYFESRPPQSDCYLAWISGRANFRIDSISFHWRCATPFQTRPVQVTTRPRSEDNLHFQDELHTMYCTAAKLSLSLMPMVVLSVILNLEHICD